MARRAVETASDNQASDIVMLDTTTVCSFTDYFIICSGESNRQIQAIRDEIEQVLKREGVTPHHREGAADSGWILLDFGRVIIHIFALAERGYYQLDELWTKATPLVRIQ
jgi:ribosome-associated protein